ncbi:MAG: hypothetical protein J6W42_04660 [Bacteroidaceae bacterium]|nr:hypothetical protein [Bacteroidaceae bacterium]
MKRFGKILMIAALAMASYSSHAELAPQWSKGTMMANAELGVSPGFGGAVSLDYVLFDDWWKGHFTVGGEIDFSRPYKHESAFGLTPRATYGLNITEEFEVHATAELGMGFWKYNYDGVHNDDTFILHSEMVGCRYFFTDGIAVMAETGYANWFPELRVGVTFMF